MNKNADLIRQLKTFKEQGPIGEKIAYGLLEDFVTKKVLTNEEAEQIKEAIE